MNSKAALKIINKIDVNKYSEVELKTNPELIEKKRLQEKYTRSWYWRTIASLIDLDNFNPSPIWIGNKLNIPIEHAVEALEGLEKLGIIRRTDKGYERILKFVYFSDRDLDKKSILSDHVLISTQIMGRLNPFNVNSNTFYRTGFVATNKQLIGEFCEKVEALMKELLEKSAVEVSDCVHGFTFSTVNITESNNSGEEL